eukprot:gene11687-15607_t
MSSDAPVTELDPQVHNGSNDMSLAVACNERTGQIVLSAVLDNLGKGAAGAAVQNLRLMTGVPFGAVTQCGKRDLVFGAVVRGRGLLDAVEFDQHGALGQTVLVDLGGQAARKKASAAGGDRRACEFCVGREFVGVLDEGNIARHNKLRLPCHLPKQPGPVGACAIRGRLAEGFGAAGSGLQRQHREAGQPVFAHVVARDMGQPQCEMFVGGLPRHAAAQTEGAFQGDLAPGLRHRMAQH